MTRKMFVVSSAVVMATVLLGCPLLKKKGADAGAGEDDVDMSVVADAATVTVTGSGAKNEKDVLRYAKEEAIADEAASIAKDGVKVRTFPGNGAEVATLSKGTAVTKVAKYFSSGVLIVWDDIAGGKLMGWVPPTSLVAPTTAAATGTATGTATATATAVFRPSDAGARVTVVDAGAKPADAGAAPVAVADAGAAAGPKPTQITYPPDATGRCPAQFVKSGPMCKRRCSIDPECPRGTFCVKDPNPTQILKVCSTDKPK